MTSPEAALPDRVDSPRSGSRRRGQARRVPRWPVLLIAAPAFVAIWGGWVGLGGMTGFGPIRLLPGIADDWVINSAITLPVGVETYAAYAMWAWLAPPSAGVSDTARRFACWSAIGALVLGAAGQVTYHLMVAAGLVRAPWQITAFVSCLPVIVLGCGAALAHLLHTGSEPVVDGELPPAVEAEPVDESPAPDPEKLDDRGLSLFWASAPLTVHQPTPVAPAERKPPRPATPPQDVDIERARELYERGARRVVLQNELGISEHKAKQLVKTLSTNGHRVS